jgi:hypothetical protein
MYIINTKNETKVSDYDKRKTNQEGCGEEEDRTEKRTSEESSCEEDSCAA